MYHQQEEELNGYTLKERLGKGGFGEVWRALRRAGRVECALKFIDLVDSRWGWREFRAVKKLRYVRRHVNLMAINAFWLMDDKGILPEGDADDSTMLRGKAKELIIEMPLAEKSLHQRLIECQKEGLPGIPPKELMRYMTDAARGIDHLNQPIHSLGGSSSGKLPIQHCDIKPQNLLIMGDAALVSDFGLAKTLGENFRTTNQNNPTSLAYAAPELLAEKSEPSTSTDQYSLAISFVQLRTGKLPFRKDTIGGMLQAHLYGELELSSLDPEEQKVIRRATSRDPTQRFPTCADMVSELEAVVTPRPVSSSSWPSGPPVAEKLGFLFPGKRVINNEYKLIERLGAGGYGEVWKAAAPGGVEVALKFVRDLESQGKGQEWKALEIVKKVKHPYLVRLNGFWLLDKDDQIIGAESLGGALEPSTLIVASELMDKTLKDRLEECREESETACGIPPQELIRHMRMSADAIDYMNARRWPLGDTQELVGIQHRDIKPENIMLFGEVAKVSDFGLATAVQGEGRRIGEQSGGMTIPYAPPEFLEDEVSDRSDQYCLALTYVKLRTGTMCFETGSVGEVLRRKKDGILDLRLLAERYERPVIARATALRPEDRFPSCLAMVVALEEALIREGIVASPPLPPTERIRGTIEAFDGARLRFRADKSEEERTYAVAEGTNLTVTRGGRPCDRRQIKKGKKAFITVQVDGAGVRALDPTGAPISSTSAQARARLSGKSSPKEARRDSAPGGTSGSSSRGTVRAVAAPADPAQAQSRPESKGRTRSALQSGDRPSSPVPVAKDTDDSSLLAGTVRYEPRDKNRDADPDQEPDEDRLVPEPLPEGLVVTAAEPEAFGTVVRVEIEQAVLLRRLTMAAVVVLLLGIAGWSYFHRPPPDYTQPEPDPLIGKVDQLTKDGEYGKALTAINGASWDPSDKEMRARSALDPWHVKVRELREQKEFKAAFAECQAMLHVSKEVPAFNKLWFPKPEAALEDVRKAWEEEIDGHIAASRNGTEENADKELKEAERQLDGYAVAFAGHPGLPALRETLEAAKDRPVVDLIARLSNEKLDLESRQKTRVQLEKLNTEDRKPFSRADILAALAKAWIHEPYDLEKARGSADELARLAKAEGRKDIEDKKTELAPELYREIVSLAQGRFTSGAYAESLAILRSKVRKEYAADGKQRDKAEGEALEALCLAKSDVQSDRETGLQLFRGLIERGMRDKSRLEQVWLAYGGLALKDELKSDQVRPLLRDALPLLALPGGQTSPDVKKLLSKWVERGVAKGSQSWKELLDFCEKAENTPWVSVCAEECVTELRDQGRHVADKIKNHVDELFQGAYADPLLKGYGRYVHAICAGAENAVHDFDLACQESSTGESNWLQPHRRQRMIAALKTAALALQHRFTTSEPSAPAYDRAGASQAFEYLQKALALNVDQADAQSLDLRKELALADADTGPLDENRRRRIAQQLEIYHPSGSPDYPEVRYMLLKARVQPDAEIATAFECLDAAYRRYRPAGVLSSGPGLVRELKISERKFVNELLEPALDAGKKALPTSGADDNLKQKLGDDLFDAAKIIRENPRWREWAGDLAKARTYMDLAINDCSARAAESYVLRGQIYIDLAQGPDLEDATRKGYLVNAVSDADRADPGALRDAPKRIRACAWEDLGWYRLDTTKFADAIREFTSIQRMSKSAEDLVDRGRCYMRWAPADFNNRYYELAAKDLQDALAARPRIRPDKEVEAHLWLAVICLNGKPVDRKKAQAHLEMAVDMMMKAAAEQPGLNSNGRSYGVWALSGPSGPVAKLNPGRDADLRDMAKAEPEIRETVGARAANLGNAWLKTKSWKFYAWEASNCLWEFGNCYIDEGDPVLALEMFGKFPRQDTPEAEAYRLRLLNGRMLVVLNKSFEAKLKEANLEPDVRDLILLGEKCHEIAKQSLWRPYPDDRALAFGLAALCYEKAIDRSPNATPEQVDGWRGKCLTLADEARREAAAHPLTWAWTLAAGKAAVDLGRKDAKSYLNRVIEDKNAPDSQKDVARELLKRASPQDQRDDATPSP